MMEGLFKYINIKYYMVYIIVHHIIIYNTPYKLHSINNKRIEIYMYMRPVCEFRFNNLLYLKVHTPDHSDDIHICPRYDNIIKSMILMNSSFVIFCTCKNVYCWFSALCRCAWPCWYCSETKGNIFHINAMIYMFVLCYWYRVCVDYRSAMSNGCDSPYWHGTLHGYNLFVYMIVVLYYTGAIRLVFIVLSLYASYMPIIMLACMCCISDVKYKLNVVVLRLIGAFRPVGSSISLGYNLFITRNGF